MQVIFKIFPLRYCRSYGKWKSQKIKWNLQAPFTLIIRAACPGILYILKYSLLIFPSPHPPFSFITFLAMMRSVWQTPTHRSNFYSLESFSGLNRTDLLKDRSSPQTLAWNCLHLDRTEVQFRVFTTGKPVSNRSPRAQPSRRRSRTLAPKHISLPPARLMEKDTLLRNTPFRVVTLSLP